MLSLTAHNRGTGIETIKTSVLMLVSNLRGRDRAVVDNLHNIEHDQGKVIGNGECAGFTWVGINLPILMNRSAMAPNRSNNTEISDDGTDLCPDDKLSLPKAKPRHDSC
jgi:hypothetical protein